MNDPSLDVRILQLHMPVFEISAFCFLNFCFCNG